MLEIQPDPAGIGGQKQPAVRVTVEALDQIPALGARHPAVEQHMAPAAGFRPTGNEFMSPAPLAEHDRFAVGLLEDFVEDGHEFLGLVAVVGFPVQEIGAVAGHAHVLQGAGQAALVGVREKAGLAPAVDDAGDDFAVFLMMAALLRGHGHEQRVVHPFGQLVQHL